MYCLYYGLIIRNVILIIISLIIILVSIPDMRFVVTDIVQQGKKPIWYAELAITNYTFVTWLHHQFLRFMRQAEETKENGYHLRGGDVFCKENIQIGFTYNQYRIMIWLYYFTIFSSYVILSYKSWWLFLGDVYSF